VVAPGATFSFVVHAATALTPPPGIQEPRAHRAFSVWLCAQGIPLGAPERLCFALAVSDLRPEASHTLAYRVHVPLPAWVAPGSYELGVRYPGGSATRPAGLQVVAARAQGVEAPGAARTPSLEAPRAGCAPRFEARGSVREQGPPGAQAGGVLVNPCAQASSARIHLAGAAGLAGELAVAARGAAREQDLEAYPLPTQSGQFADGVVILLRLAPGQSLELRPRATPAPVGGTSARILARPTGTGDRIALRLTGAARHARVFWWLSPWESGTGPEVSTAFGGSRSPTAVAVAIAPDGSYARASYALAREARPARETGLCQFGKPGELDLAAGLLFLALSRKIGPARVSARSKRSARGRARGTPPGGE
jgi:hypothetical protein